MTGFELHIIWLSIRVAIISTVITIPLAIWLAWVLVRKRIVCKPLIEAFISFPLVAPPVITGYVLLLLLGNKGVLGSFFYRNFGISLMFNFTALVIASIVVSLPLAVRAVRSSFEHVDSAYEKASLTLGAPPVSTFFRVSLPMALPGIISGMVLVFARSLGEFGATITLAGNITGKTQTISLMVYSNMQVPGKEMAVTRLVVFSVIISFTAIVLSEYFNKKGRFLKK